MSARQLSLAVGIGLLMSFAVAPLAAETTVERISLDEPAPGDLVAEQLHVSAPAGAPLTRQPISVSRLLDPARPLAATLETPATESRRYWFELTAAELRRGTGLPPLSAGALVRVSPMGQAAFAEADAASVAPSSLLLVSDAGQTLSGSEAFALSANAEEFAGSPAPFSPGSSAVQVRADLPDGVWRLEAPDLDGRGLFLIHVFEKMSDVALTTELDRAIAFSGETLRVEAGLSSASRMHGPAMRLDTVSGILRSPSGREKEVDFRQLSDSRHAALIRPTAQGLERGLWSLEVTGLGDVAGIEVVRRSRVHFSVSLPTARFSRSLELHYESEGRSVRAEVGVEVGSEGRFEARGTLFATNSQGQLVPVALGQSAAWMTAGADTLVLEFEVPSEFAAPFSLRDLRLSDQSRLSVVELRASDGSRLFAIDRQE